MVCSNFPPIASQKSADTIEECTKFPESISANPKIFLCFTLNFAYANLLGFSFPKLFNLTCNDRTSCNRLTLFTLLLIVLLLLLHLETIRPVIASFTENPLVSGSLSSSVPGAF